MDAEAIGKRLQEAFHPYAVPEWELEAHAEDLATLPEEAQRRVLDLVPAIWPVSHALTFSFLRHARRGTEVFGETRLQIWVGAILDAYEAGGLEEAQPIVADGGRALLRELRGESGVRFRDAVHLLHPYACGLAQRALAVAEGREASGDTATIWLPRRIAVFEDAVRNLLLYKLATAVHCGHVTLGTYRAELPPGHQLVPALEQRFGGAWPGRNSWLEDFFELFPEPALAGRLYQAAATARVAAGIATRFPGLWREAVPVLADLFSTRPAAAALSPREGLLEAIRRWTWLADATAPDVAALLEPLRGGQSTPQDAVLTTAGLYPLAATLPGGDPAATPPPFEGILLPAEAEERRQARRREAREEFVDAFRAILAGGFQEAREPGPAGKDEEEERPATTRPPADGTSVARASAAAGGDGATLPEFIRIGARLVEIPEGMRPLVEEIRDDLGGIPDTYVSGAIAAAGGPVGAFAGPAVPGGPPAEEWFLYDEWDFRRAGYRRDWCSLRELELAPGDPGFVAATVRAYRGPLVRIRRAFELMRTGERFLRRQRDGDEIDIDAVIESRSDTVAGRPASDRLFIRLVRDTRDIAAVFLVDRRVGQHGDPRVAGPALRGPRGARRSLRRLRILGREAAARRAVQDQAARRGLRSGREGADRGDRAARLHADGPPDPPRHPPAS